MTIDGGPAVADVDLVELAHAYDSDEAFANSKYAGTRIRAAGVVLRTGRNQAHSPYVDVGAAPGASTFARCMTDATPADGARVRFHGKVSGNTLGAIEVDECAIEK